MQRGHRKLLGVVQWAMLGYVATVMWGPVAHTQALSNRSANRNAEAQSSARLGGCLNSVVEFDGSAVKSIVLDPERILSDADDFWNRNDTFRLVKLWHQYRDIAFPQDVWLERIRRFANTPAGERSADRILLMQERLMSRQQEFHEHTVRHVCSFLPHPEIDFNTTVHLAIGTDFPGFAADNFIVISISDPFWRGEASAILNAMVHEVFHIGYGWNSYLHTEAPLGSRLLGDMLQRLQNEGMATYVAYLATDAYPAPADRDYRKLEEEAEVLESLSSLSELFREAEFVHAAQDSASSAYLTPDWIPAWAAKMLGYDVPMTREELRREEWRVGVEQRAYYVGGAYMARVIDERLGREALVATVAEGPRSFLQTYNDLVDERHRVHVFEFDGSVPAGEVLRRAALDEEHDRLSELLSTIRSDPPDDGRLQWDLWRMGNLLRLTRRLDLAEEVYETMLQVNPASADALNGLGLIHLERGELSLALARFRRSNELEPHRPLAFKMVRELDPANRG